MDITFSIFPKFYKHLSVDELASLVREVGLDATNLVIRDGYWVQPDSLAKDVPAFVKAMDSAGIEVRFATAGFSAGEIIHDEEPLKILADNGIADFRMGYFRGGDKQPAEALAEARAQMCQVASVCERVGIRAVYQVHHGTHIVGPTAAYQLLKGLPSEYVGVMLDPGNQAFEGFEKWSRSAALLGQQLVAIGVKDVAWVRDESQAAEPHKGWQLQWATLDEGITNWYDLVTALKANFFNGTFVWMPFYDEDDPDQMTCKLKHEVAYLRKVVADVEAEG
ncbi:MAG: sugar phosphate isomerase/epimerase family protein [Phycisphaerae bacterium]